MLLEPVGHRLFLAQDIPAYRRSLLVAGLWLFLIVLLVLAVAALVKYLFFDKKR